LFGDHVQQQPSDALVGAWRTLLTPIVTQHLLGPITVSIEGRTAGPRSRSRVPLRRWHLYQSGNLRLLELAGGK
jgi:hypothetical protein